MKNIITYLLLLISTVSSVRPAFIPGLSQSNTGEAKPLKRIDKRLQALEKERGQLKTALADIRPLMHKTSGELDLLRRKRFQGKRQELLAKEISLISQEYQSLTEIETELQQMITNIDAHVKTIREYASDENFESLRIASKAYYDFDDIQAIAQKLVETKSALADAEKMKIALTDDSNKRKKSLVLLQEEYKNKKKQQQNFAQRFDEGSSAAQQARILDAEVRLADFKKNIADMKVAEVDRKLSFTDDLIALYTDQLVVLRKEYTRVQRSARVSAAYVKQMEEQLEAKRQQFVSKSDRLQDKMRVILAADVEIKHKIRDAQSKFDISASDSAALRTLTKELNSATDWNVFLLFLHLLSQEALLEVERDYLAAQMELEKAQFGKEELEVSIVQSWYKMTSDVAGFHTDDEVDQEIKMYRLLKTELEARLLALTATRDNAINNLQQLNGHLEKLKGVVKLLNRAQHAALKDNQQLYEYGTKVLYETEENIRHRLHWVAKLIEASSASMVTVQGTIKKVDGIIDELRNKSFWRRSDQSIRWHKLPTVAPDLERFVRDLRRGIAYLFSYERLSQGMALVGSLFSEPLKLILIIINAIIAILIFFLLRLYLPDVIGALHTVGQGYPLIRTLSFLLALVLQFLMNYFTGVYLWTVLFVVVNTGMIQDTVLIQLFYLFSLPYLLFLAYHFFIYAAQVNRQRNFQFMSEGYARLFFWLVPHLAYALITLSLFRQAFVLGGYRGSQVPIVLMAVMFTLCQIVLISLLRKDAILNTLRSDTPLWEWIHEHVIRYYYPLCAVVVGIIVVSNPYVGYGRQVLYIVSRLLFTLALIPLFSWAHNRMKRMAVDLFFYYTDTDAVKERFAAGRFLYGIFVISTLIVFVIAGIWFGARIWGTSLTLRDVASWLDYSLYTQFDEKGNDVSVRVSSLFNIFFFVVGGIAVAAFINRFVLRRALDPFLVEPGVQNTILTLVKYIIIITAVFMGLNMAHLEGLTTKLAILIAGVGFAAQEAVRDFFSYFILLVQRPIKIGDLIEVADMSRENNPLIGVVRHITPRTVMIRQRNSVTTIIPNSRVIMNPVINWSYSRSFIGFDDMLIAISYTADPTAVRALILSLMDKNPHILKSPAPVVRLHNFLEHGYQFLIRGYLASEKVMEQWDIASDFRFELVKQLKAAGIEIATPVRTVKMIQEVKER